MTQEELQAAWDAYYLGGGKERLEQFRREWLNKKGHKGTLPLGKTKQEE